MHRSRRTPRAVLVLALTPARRHRRLAALLTIVVLLSPALLMAGGREHIHADGPPRNGITMTAEGTATLPPDVARISGTIETRAETAADALGQNTDILNAVIAAVKTLGATDRDIRTSGVRRDPINAPGGGVTGYRALNGISIRTTDLTKIGDLIQAMVGANITNIQNVDYALQDPDQLQLLAVESAIANARRRGEAVAAALGVRLGVALDFSFGTRAPVTATPLPAPPPPPPTAVAARAAPAPPPPPPVMPTSFSASSQVTVTFAIQGQ